jgi:hypothetical protein
MALPITSHVASVPERPEWVAFEPRAVLAVCGCAQRVHGVWYARSGCAECGGAGLRRATPILSAHELVCSGEG